MPNTKMPLRSPGGGRSLFLCYYHRRFDKEAAKCKNGKNDEYCEFQRLTFETSDLRNKIRHDQRNSLKRDLRDHLKKAKRPEQRDRKRPEQSDRKRSRPSRPRTHQEKEEYLFERKSNSGSKARVDHKYGHGKLIHVSEIQEEEDTTDSQEDRSDKDHSSSTGRRRRSRERSKNETLYYRRRQMDETKTILNDHYMPDRMSNKDRSDRDRSSSTGRRRRSRERSQNETSLYYRRHQMDVTKTISNDRYTPEPRNQEDRTDDKNQSHRFKKKKHPNDPNDRKGSRSDSNYPNNNRGSKIESNSRERPRYKPNDRKNSGYENPTSSRKNKRGNKEDTDSDTEDNLATPKRKRRKPLKDDSNLDSEKMRPTHNYLKTPKEGKQNQRNESQSLQDPKYQELLQYLRKQQQQTSSESSSDSSSESSSESSSGTSSDDEKVEDGRNARHGQPTNDEGADRSGMPKNEKKPNQCPVPLCEASNRAVKNQKGKYKDTEVAHRYVLNCPRIREMSINNRWEYFKKAGCKCKRCFSTQHKYHSCPMQLRNPKFCNVQIGNKNKCGGAHHWLLHVDGHI